MEYKTFHDWILKNLKPNLTLLEFGSGPGTDLFTEKFNVYSIEHDEKYVGNSKYSNYIYAPINNGWYNVDNIKKHITNLKYDMVLVDGPTGLIGRGGLLKNLNLFNTEVIWVFDDINRQKEKEIFFKFIKLTNKKYKIYDGEYIKTKTGGFVRQFGIAE